MNKREIAALGQSVGAVVVNHGRVWTATFPGTDSLYAPGEPVTLEGNRDYLVDRLSMLDRNINAAYARVTKLGHPKGKETT